MKSPTVFFDSETAGLEPKHPTIQLAAVAIKGWKEVGTFERKIRFAESDADPEALEMNSYDRRTWAQDGVPERQALNEFAEFLRPFACVTFTSKRTGNPYSVSRLAGHNIQGFDLRRLRDAYQRNRIFLPADGYRGLDTMQLALWHYAQEGRAVPSFKLVDLCQDLGIPTDDAHDALADVRMSIRIAEAILCR